MGSYEQAARAAIQAANVRASFHREALAEADDMLRSMSVSELTDRTADALMRMPLTQVLDSVPQSISDQMTALIERAAEEIATDRCALARVVC